MASRSDSPQQLDLFSMRVTSVVPFPLAKVTCEVRAAAAELLSLPALAERERAWKRIIGRHKKRLATLGLTDIDVVVQIDAYRTAVACEARRRVILGIDNDRGAA